MLLCRLATGGRSPYLTVYYECFLVYAPRHAASFRGRYSYLYFGAYEHLPLAPTQWLPATEAVMLRTILLVVLVSVRAYCWIHWGLMRHSRGEVGPVVLMCACARACVRGSTHVER